MDKRLEKRGVIEEVGEVSDREEVEELCGITHLAQFFELRRVHGTEVMRDKSL